MVNIKHGGTRIRPDIINEIHNDYLETYPCFVDQSCKPEDLHAENTNRFVKDASFKHQALRAPSNKRQARRRKLQALSRKLQAQ